MVVVLDASNFLAIGLAFFVLMIGIMLVMVGAVVDMDTKKSSPIRPIQKLLEKS